MKIDSDRRGAGGQGVGFGVDLDAHEPPALPAQGDAECNRQGHGGETEQGDWRRGRGQCGGDDQNEEDRAQPEHLDPELAGPAVAQEQDAQDDHHRDDHPPGLTGTAAVSRDIHAGAFRAPRRVEASYQLW